MVVAFQEMGDKPEVIVETQEIIESHKRLKPVRATEILDQLQSGQDPITPHIVVIRELSENMLKIAKWAQARGARVIHYTQKPSRRERGYTAFRQDLTKIRAKQLASLPLSTITPVDHNNTLPSKLFHHRFNFPVLAGPQKLPARDNQIQVLLVGKLAQPRKRHFWAIDALRVVQHPCKLVICGADLDMEADDGTRSKEYYQQLMDVVSEEKKNGQLVIEIHANVPPAEMNQHYQESDIFVLPALNEEFGISVLEAMSYGCATITTNEVGASRHIISGINGHVVDAHNESSFRTVLKDLLSDTSKRKQIQEAAIATIAEKHGTEQFREFIISRA